MVEPKLHENKIVSLSRTCNNNEEITGLFEWTTDSKGTPFKRPFAIVGHLNTKTVNFWKILFLSKATCFSVYGKVITRLTIAKVLLTGIDRVHPDGIMGSLTGQEKNGPNHVRLQNLQRFRREYGLRE